MYTYVNTKSRLQQPKTSLLHCQVKDLWFVEANWSKWEGHGNTTKPNKNWKTKEGNTRSMHIGKIFWRNQIISHQTAGQLRSGIPLRTACFLCAYPSSAYPANRIWAAISTVMDISTAGHNTLDPPFALKSAVLSLSMQWTLHCSWTCWTILHTTGSK